MRQNRLATAPELLRDRGKAALRHRAGQYPASRCHWQI